MEVQRSKGEDIPDDAFNAIKSGLMGPMAALGDSLFASTGNALLLSFGMGLALEGNVMGTHHIHGLMDGNHHRLFFMGSTVWFP